MFMEVKRADEPRRAADSELAEVHVELGLTVVPDPVKCFFCILDGLRILLLGREAVVDGNDDTLGP